MTDDLATQSAFALAYQDALERQAAEQAHEQARAEAERAEHVYDPLPYPEAEPHDPTLYKGTGIGALYGIPGCEQFLTELGDWTLAPRTTR